MIASLSVEAERELIDAANYYAEHAGPDLGLAFIAEFERALAVLCDHPHLGPVWRGKSRRFPLRRFPYSVIYRLRIDELYVVALAHQRRRPTYWVGR